MEICNTMVLFDASLIRP